MVLGRRPYELYVFARKREPGRAKTVIPSGHPQPASYHPTLLPFRLFHAHLVAPLGVRKKRNPTNYLQFSFDCLAIWPPVWSRRRGSNLSCFRLIPFRTATSPDVKIAFPVPAGRSAPPVPLLVHPADGDHPHFHPRGVEAFRHAVWFESVVFGRRVGLKLMTHPGDGRAPVMTLLTEAEAGLTGS